MKNLALLLLLVAASMSTALLTAPPALAAQGAPVSNLDSGARSAIGTAEARGWLHRAYDSMDSGLLEEAQSYLGEVVPGTPLDEDVVFALVEVLFHQEKFAEVEKLLLSARGQVLPEAAYLLEELYEVWSQALSREEKYSEAKSLALSGAKKLDGSEYLSALSRAYAYRSEIKEAALKGESTKLKGGGRLAVLKRGRSPEGGGEKGAEKSDGMDSWQRICPPAAEGSRGAELTCNDWMPLTAAELEGEGLELWLLVEETELRQALEFELKRLALSISGQDAGSVVVREGDESTWIDLENLRVRTAVEGLGIRASALLAAQQAASELKNFTAISRWIALNKGELEVEPYGMGAYLTHSATQRSFQLDYRGWQELFAGYPDEWSDLWTEIGRELGKSPRPYRCFCGREVFLRESYLPGVDTLAESGSGDGKQNRALGQWGMMAYCSEHRMFLDEKKLAEWGVTADEAAEKCRVQASESPWELLFRKLKIGEDEVYFLTGGGATALSRNTDVLLGIVEQFNGRPMAGETIKVWAPSDEVLIVGGVETPGDEVNMQADNFLRALQLPRAALGPYYGFEKIIRLPQTKRGTVLLHAME